MLSLHSSLCPGQLQSLVCVKKYVKVCTGVLVTQTYIQLHVGKFKRSIQKVPPVFEREQEEQNSFCRSSPAKCMSCVSSFQLCYLSYWGFLSIVKLLGLNNVQFYIFIYTVCVNRVDQRRGNWISGNEILCSVKVKWFRVYSQYYQFKQCTSEIKVLNSTLSFDYKHMSGALRLTPPLQQPQSVLNPLFFTPSFPCKANFQRIQKRCWIIKNPSHCKKRGFNRQMEHKTYSGNTVLAVI